MACTIQYFSCGASLCFLDVQQPSDRASTTFRRMKLASCLAPNTLRSSESCSHISNSRCGNLFVHSYLAKVSGIGTLLHNQECSLAPDAMELLFQLLDRSRVEKVENLCIVRDCLTIRLANGNVYLHCVRTDTYWRLVRLHPLETPMS